MSNYFYNCFEYMILDIFNFPILDATNLMLKMTSTLKLNGASEDSTDTVAKIVSNHRVELFAPFSQLNEEFGDDVYGGFCGTGSNSSSSSAGSDSTDYSLQGSAQTFEACMLACRDQSSCLAFEWYNATLECELWVTLPTHTRFNFQYQDVTDNPTGFTYLPTINGQCFERQNYGLSSDSATLTLRGRGFDSTNTSKNVVSFSNTDIKGLVSKSTRTTLELAFTHLSPLYDGEDLKAIVTVAGTWSSGATHMIVAKVCISFFFFFL